MDWIARPINPAMERTRILPPHLVCAAAASGDKGTVFVTTTSLRQELVMLSIAGPENTGCEQQAYTAKAPFSSNALAAFTSVPAVSIRSSMTKHVRPLT